MEGADVVTPSSSLPAYASGRPPDPLHIRKNTQKSKFLLSQALKWKKIMFFVIPEMPSKTFVIVLKNFLITSSEHATCVNAYAVQIFGNI